MFSQDGEVGGKVVGEIGDTVYAFWKDRYCDSGPNARSVVEARIANIDFGSFALNKYLARRGHGVKPFVRLDAVNAIDDIPLRFRGERKVDRVGAVANRGRELCLVHFAVTGRQDLSGGRVKGSNIRVDREVGTIGHH